MAEFDLGTRVQLEPLPEPSPGYEGWMARMVAACWQNFVSLSTEKAVTKAVDYTAASQSLGAGFGEVASIIRATDSDSLITFTAVVSLLQNAGGVRSVSLQLQQDNADLIADHVVLQVPSGTETVIATITVTYEATPQVGEHTFDIDMKTNGTASITHSSLTLVEIR